MLCIYEGYNTFFTHKSFTYYLLLSITYFYLLPTISTRVSITSLRVKLFLKVSFSVARWCSTNSARRRFSGISRSCPHVDLGPQPLDLRCHKRHFNALDSIVSYYQVFLRYTFPFVIKFKNAFIIGICSQMLRSKIFLYFFAILKDF